MIEKPHRFCYSEPMKQYAYRLGSLHPVPISAWDALALRNQGIESKFTSLQLDPKRRREVILVHTQNQCFFRYKNNINTSGLGSEQTLTHLFAKEIIAKMKNITFLLPDGPITLNVAHWAIEQRIEVEEAHTYYYADLAAYGIHSSDPQRTKGWGHLLVEITVTHAGSDYRAECLQKAGWAIIEVRIPLFLHIPQDLFATEKEIKDAIKKMERAFHRGVRARLIADPAKPIPRKYHFLAKLRPIWESLIVRL